jgi:hypothetical protein
MNLGDLTWTAPYAMRRKDISGSLKISEEGVSLSFQEG